MKTFVDFTIEPRDDHFICKCYTLGYLGKDMHMVASGKTRTEAILSMTHLLNETIQNNLNNGIDIFDPTDEVLHRWDD